ncbi:rhamnulokinase [Microbacterium immunditiarum]|uniref:Rhamnulokinase n=1 Tax=Microbacterium immunditiarum TaxID=337480 RepID=A0A7Y9GK83_9MICO|nr:rhamnulokinase family protein [Microbacterium immunditiarum]NYE17988.1 rhamnulokinase [Microbacterium immunditiarum]
MSRAFAAVDLGATSGRVIVGRVADGLLRTTHLARFGNDPVRTRDGLHWNVLELYRQLLLGLAAAERDAPGEIASVGIDSWAVDYGLMRGGRLLGMPFHYRDARNEAGVAAVHDIVGPADLYQRNGLQHLPFNTLFQLAAEGDLLGMADRMLLIPDLLTYWLTGAEVAERTNASTTGLLDPGTREWDVRLAEELGIPSRILPPLVDPGTTLGALDPAAALSVGRALEVVAVGSHDTASAVVAIPNPGGQFAYISCGTWGLVGLELDRPVLTEDARLANFTNEGGVDGRTRFLHNVMGLWLLSESLRHWEPGATDAQRSSLLSELLEQAGRVRGPVPVFDADDSVFLPPGDIPGRIRAWCRQHEQPVPQGRDEIVRSIVESLAAAFATTVEQAAVLADVEIHVIHIVGGGAQNTLLCQATANRTGLPVVAGPVEATAMGNLLVQARAAGEVAPDLGELRAVVARSAPVARYAPERTG